MAGKYEMLGITMRQAGKNAGYAEEEMAAFEAGLRRTGIAAIESRQTLTRMAASHIDLAESAKLARAAQDLAVVGAINSSEAFERVTYAIQSAQVEMLRTIGLNVSFEEGYKKTAEQLGVNTTQLTEYQKIQSRVNTVLESAAQYQGIYEKSMSSAEKQMGSLNRYIDDYKVAFGEAFQPAYLRMVEAKIEAYKNLKETVSDPEFQENMKALANIFADIYEWASKIPDVISRFITGMREAAKIGAEYHLNLPAELQRLTKGPSPTAAVTLPSGLMSEDEKRRWIKVFEGAKEEAGKLEQKVSGVKDETSVASDEAKRLAKEWASTSRGLERKIELVGLEGFEKEKKDLELEVKDLRKELGDKPLITKYFDVNMADIQAREVEKKGEERIKAEVQYDEYMGAEKEKNIKKEMEADEGYLKFTKEQCTAREQLEENLTEATADGLQKRLHEAEKWAKEMDELNAFSAQSNEEYEERKIQITETAERMKAKITEDYASDQQKEWEKYLINMENFFEDVFVGKIKNIWEALVDWMRGIFTRFIARLAAEKIVIPITAQIIGAAPALAGEDALLSAAGTGALGKLMGSLSKFSSFVGDLGGTMLGSISSMENIVNALGGATEGVWNVLNTVTPYLPLLGPLAMGLSGNYGGAIGGLAGFGGSIALGATLGSVVPGIGTAIGAIIGTLVGKLFEDKEEPRIKIDWKGFFNVEDQDTELGEAQKVIEDRFGQIRKTLLNFARDAGLDTSRFFQEWKSDWKKLKDEGDVEEAVNKWISQYVGFVLPQINFERFKKEGEDLAATIDRIITSISQIKGTFESFDTYISVIKGSFDEILEYKNKMKEVTENIKEVRKSLRTATDPSDAITYANALKEAIYNKYILEKNLIESISKQWEDVISSVDKQIYGLISGTGSPQTGFERMSYVRSEMEKARGLYLGATGEEKAGYAGELQGIIADYIEAAQEVYQRPSPEYKAIYDEMMGWLQGIKEEAMEERMDNLSKIIGNKTVDEYLAKLQERAVTQLENISALLEKVLNKLLPGVKGYQSGGYIPQRTLAWLGEREPEWVIPQSKMGRVGSQTVAITNNIMVHGSGNINEEKLGKEISNSIFFSLEHGKGKQILKKVMQFG